MNFYRLLQKAKSEQISRNEFEYIINELKQKDSKVDKYTLIHILGLSGFEEAESYIKPFLDDNDQKIKEISIKSLFKNLCLYETYLSFILRFLDEEENDKNKGLRYTCASLLAEYVSNTRYINIEKISEILVVAMPKTKDVATLKMLKSAQNFLV